MQASSASIARALYEPLKFNVYHDDRPATTAPVVISTSLTYERLELFIFCCLSLRLLHFYLFTESG